MSGLTAHRSPMQPVNLLPFKLAAKRPRHRNGDNAVLSQVSRKVCAPLVVRIYSIATVSTQAKPIWHPESVLGLFKIVVRLFTDLLALTTLAFRRRRTAAAEILVLRRQIALYKERGIEPRRIDPATRISLTSLTRFFNWRDALVVVRPETMLR
jgi:hypothetical protein